MSRLSFWVSGKPAEVRCSGAVLEVRRSDEPVERIGLATLGLLVISGQHQIDAGVLRQAAARNVRVLLLDRRARNAAWIGQGLGNSARLRTLQHQAYQLPSARVDLARSILRLKFEAYQNLAEVRGGAGLAADTLAAALNQLERFACVDALRGVEGATAAMVWRWFATQVPPPFVFRQRARRPPPDPVNACLSLGYTLVQAEAQAAMDGAGFDPALGFLHDVLPARASLLFELIEPLRAGVDQFVLTVLPLLSPDDFRTEAGRGCYLSQAGQRTFFCQWAGARAHWPVRVAGALGEQSLLGAARAIATALRAQIFHTFKLADDEPEIESI